VANYETRLDHGTEKGEVIFMEGQVQDTAGKPIAGATVEVSEFGLTNDSFFMADKSVRILVSGKQQGQDPKSRRQQTILVNPKSRQRELVLEYGHLALA
jgi:hypothetical protein